MLTEDIQRSTGKGNLWRSRAEDYWLELMPDAELRYTVNEVKRAGKILRDPNPNPDDYSKAQEVFENWRACHSVPLNQFYDSLQQHVRLGSLVASVVHRPKRIEAVIKKLRREHNAQLSTMHDIAGCRVIVKSISDVEKIVEACNDLFSSHVLRNVYPYIEKPNPKTGYRGVHLVYSYQSERPAFNGRLIEIQVRTSAQHAWATTVETVDLIQKQSLKSGHGDPSWQRFFCLMSSVIARQESRPLVPDTPSDPGELENDLRHYADVLQVKRHLQFYSAMARLIGQGYEKVPQPKDREPNLLKFYLMELDVNLRKLSVYIYREDEVKQAYEDVATLERIGKNVVLAGAQDFWQLKAAFPNWFIDTHNFLMLLNHALGEDIHSHI